MRSILCMRKIRLSTFLALVISMVILSMGVVSFCSLATQTNSTATVYLDPPTINGTAIGQEFTVNIRIRDAVDVYSWQAGLIFNSTLLNCTGVFEGEFLKDVGITFWQEGTINNTKGEIVPYGCVLLEDVKASGDGRLGYATFKVKASGVSDLHLRDVKLGDVIEVSPGRWEGVVIPSNIIDVYTVVLDTTPYTIVTLSNSTGTPLRETPYHSGLYGHAFTSSLNETSFSVTSPNPIFCDVAIPKTLLPPPVDPYVWGVLINGSSVSKTVTDNATHTFIYFTYDAGINEVAITTRFVPSTITMSLSSTSITKGNSVAISGGIDPIQEDVNVTILYRLSGKTEWTTLANVTTNQNSEYSYVWTPTETKTYQVKARWEGDQTTLGAESEVQSLTVKAAGEGIPIEIIAAVAVAIIIIAAIVVYFVKFRKPEEE